MTKFAPRLETSSFSVQDSLFGHLSQVHKSSGQFEYQKGKFFCEKFSLLGRLCGQKAPFENEIKNEVFYFVFKQ